LASGQTIIDRAMRLIGAIGSGESPTAAETTDVLAALNAMIESWQTERLYVYAMVDTAFTLVPTDASYTVGPAGNFSLTPRPQKIENVYIRESNIDYPVKLIDFKRWDAIADKTSTSNIPEYAYYEPTLPTGTLQLGPVPSRANSLHIVTWTTLASLATAGTTVTLPQGYERALSYNLAIEIAPEFEKQVSVLVQQVAAEAKANIKRANQRPLTSYTELAMLTGTRGSSIESDQP
jgi:hypothetical protein